MAWIDSNGLYSGTWHYTEHGYGLPNWDGVRDELAARMAGAGCSRCHGKSVGSDWFNLQSPELSRILRAPLKAGRDGRGLAICRDHKMDPGASGLVCWCKGTPMPSSLYPNSRHDPCRRFSEGGQPHVSFSSTEDPHYKAMLAIIRRGRKSALATPRIDMPGAEAIVGKCRMLVPPELPKQTPRMKAYVDESRPGPPAMESLGKYDRTQRRKSTAASRRTSLRTPTRFWPTRFWPTRFWPTRFWPTCFWPTMSTTARRWASNTMP